MKNFKRKLAGFLVFAMVLGIMAPGVVAQAADSAVPEVEFNLLDETATLKNASGYTVEYADSAVKVTASGSALTYSNAAKAIKDTAWEEVEKGADTIDLSWVGKKKDVWLVFKFTKKGADTTYVVKKVAAQPTIKVGFTASTESAVKVPKTQVEVTADKLVGDGETGFLFFYDATDKNNPVVLTPSSVQYKKGVNGKWNYVDEKAADVPESASARATTKSVDLKDALPGFKAKGATLYFQSFANTEAWPSKEVKYSYKKQANAPKIKIDVLKQTVTFKAGQEYKVVVDDQETQEDWIKVDKIAAYKNERNKIDPVVLTSLATKTDVSGSAVDVKETLSEDDIYGTEAASAKSIVIKVRTAGTTTKMPSKAYKVNVKVISGGADVVEIKTGTSASVMVDYKVPYNSAKGVVVTNNSKINYEIAYVPSGESITSKTKWTKLKANSTKPGTANIKVGTDPKKGQFDPKNPGTLYVRMQGDKKAVELGGKATTFDMANLSVKTPHLVSTAAVTTTGASIEVAAVDTIKATIPASGGAVAELTKVEQEVVFEDVTHTGTSDSITVTPKASSKNSDITVDKIVIAKDGKAKVSVSVKAGAKVGNTYTFKVNDREFKLIVEIK